MTTLTPTAPSPFSWRAGFYERAAVRQIHEAAPAERDWEELLLAKLGPRGWGRVHQFRTYYASGWSEDQRPAISPRALSAFFGFLKVFTFPSGVIPSVFLTDGGGIELCWEDEERRALQVEFTRAGAEFYREATGQEGELAHGDLRQLLARLSS